MKKADLLKQLNNYQALVQSYDEELEKLSQALPGYAIYETPVFQAAEALITQASSQLFKPLFSFLNEDLLFDWRYSHRFGKHPMLVRNNKTGQKLHLSSNEEFANYFGD